MNMRTKMKLALWYMKYRKYLWPGVAIVALLVVAYFVWPR
jgi:hypothetical protein